MAVIRFLLSRWVLTFVGAALLACLVWFFGPLLSALEDPIVRAVILLAIFVVWLVVNLLLHLRREKADAALAQGATEGPSATDVALAEEASAMRDKLAQALGLLKRARGTHGYLYEQPWYVIIGPPGAGKTTALLNAGLHFPLAAEMGQGPVAGVGGTRLCEWWFTDDAVLIDTAGRYTTQDSDAAVDKAGWDAFLDLLKRTRVRQPLNGVIIAISVADIAQAPQAERQADARAVRRRVKEITDRLGVRVPVYALFTKADLLAGFTEFFDDLDSDARAQVWGTTFPLAIAGPITAFPAEFKQLLERLNARLLDRLQAERGPDRRALLAGFPAQVASLEQPVMEFLQEAFGGSKLDPAPFLRGVYLASGTQEGTPIDRLTGALARAFGVDQRRAPSLRPQQGRGYFLGRLLKDVIFGEAMLVSEKPGAARRRLLLRAGAFAIVGLEVVTACGLLWRSRIQAQAETDRLAAALTAYEQTAQPLPLNPVADDDLKAVAPLLDQARALPHGYDLGRDEGSSWVRLGLSQNDKLAVGAKGVYRRALERVLLPRLVWRLEGEIRGNLTNPDFAYEATRIYLMLGGQGPLDRALVRYWMTRDWERQYPGALDAPLRADLARHLDALLENPLPPIGLDGTLVADARVAFAQIPLARRVYSRIQPDAVDGAVKPWTPGEALGISGAQLFVRRSGKPLTEGIPGFFTKEGFYKLFLPALPAKVKEVAGESWVLGKRAEVDPTSPEARDLERDVIKLYTDDYIKIWDAMLADLDVVPLRDVNQAATSLLVLSSPQSPLRDLLKSIADQVTLSMPPPPPAGAAGVADAAAAAVAKASSGAAAALDKVLGAPAGPPPDPPGKAVDDHFKALRDLIGSGAPGAPVDSLLGLLKTMQDQLARVATPGGAGAAAAPGEDPVKQVRAAAQAQPDLVKRVLATLASGNEAVRGGSVRQGIQDAWGGTGAAQLCAAVEGRYPFRAGAANDVPLDDFGRLLAPGGLLDGFFNTQLRPFVDQSGRVWRPKDVGGVSPVSASDVAAFQRAAIIRDLFFAAGGNQPTIHFDIQPISSDSGARQVTLDFDGVSIVYAHGINRPTQITWPGPNRMTNVRLVFDPPPSSGPPVLQASGPWALFRLFNQGSLQNAGGAELYTLTFNLADRQVTYEIRAGSVQNPFAPGVLQDFRCPALR